MREEGDSVGGERREAGIEHGTKRREGRTGVYPDSYRIGCRELKDATEPGEPTDLTLTQSPGKQPSPQG